MDDGHESNAPRDPYRGFREALEAVSFVCCYIDEVGIADFLKHTTRFRTLTYSHPTKDNIGPRYCDICKLVVAFGREVGSHRGRSLTGPRTGLR